MTNNHVIVTASPRTAPSDTRASATAGSGGAVPPDGAEPANRCANSANSIGVADHTGDDSAVTKAANRIAGQQPLQGTVHAACDGASLRKTVQSYVDAVSPQNAAWDAIHTDTAGTRAVCVDCASEVERQ